MLSCPILKQYFNLFGQCILTQGYNANHFALDFKTQFLSRFMFEDERNGIIPVVAAHRGVVTHADTDSQGGKIVHLTSVDTIEGKSYLTLYYHLDRFVCKKGDQLNNGDLIGYSGSTGTTGAHLHFAMTLDDDFVNPLKYLMDGVVYKVCSAPFTSEKWLNGHLI